MDAAGSDSRPPRLADLEAVGVADVTRSSKPLVLEASEVPSLFGQLMPSVQGMLLSGALNVACKLRIPDAMGSESLSVSEIAGEHIQCPGAESCRCRKGEEDGGAKGMLI